MEIIELNIQNIPQVGNILYKVREHIGVGQKAVAATMGKSQCQVSGMENNRKTPGLKNLAKYLGALNGKCRLAILMTGAEDEQEIPPGEATA